MSANEGYRIVRPLGASPAGTVYLGETERGPIAICQFESPLEPGTPFWQTDRDRFLEAGRRARALTHPRILAALEVIDEAGEAFVTSEYAEGETLQAALASRRFSIDEAGAILGQIAAALDFAHSRGVVHGDLKPSAIHLTPNQGVRVGDFGISPLAHWDTRRPVPVNLLHEFLSPEHVRDPGSVDGRSDQYTLAVIAYWMFTGQSPYSQSSGDPAAAILSAAPVPPSRLEQRVPPSFDGPILRALDRSPARRFDSCEAFVQSLVPASIPQPDVVTGRRPRTAVWVAGGAVAVLAVAGYLLLRGGAETSTASNASEPPVAGSVGTGSEAADSRKATTKDVLRPKPFGTTPAYRAAVAPPAPQPTPPTQEPTPQLPAPPSAPAPALLPTPPRTAPSSSFDLQIFSRGKPLSDGQRFGLLDPIYGEMAFGDLTAIVAGANSAMARHLAIEWTVSGVRHASCGMPGDSCAVHLNETLSYRNEPSPGSYVVKLTMDGRPVRTVSFEITP